MSCGPSKAMRDLADQIDAFDDKIDSLITESPLGKLNDLKNQAGDAVNGVMGKLESAIPEALNKITDFMDKTLHEDVSDLDVIRDQKVKYLGSLQQNQLFSIYKACDNFIHLAWLDHCPNVVVDARACGCKIICSSAGGTKEIAGKDAIIVEEEEWNFEPVDLYSPPKLDFSAKVVNNSNSELDMKMVSKQYEKFLENLL